MEQLGTLLLMMYVVEPSHTDPTNPDADRMRKVTLLRRHAITEADARALAVAFIRGNALSDERKYQIEASWTYKTYLLPE
jgi:hypothetical protein